MIKYFYIFIISSLVSSSAFFYYQNTKYRNDIIEYSNTLAQKNLEIANIISINKQNAEDYSKREQDLQKTIEDYSNIIDQLNIIELNRQELGNKLNRHDLEELSLVKPQLIENILNKSSEEYNNCIEVVTDLHGDILPNNNECSWLVE